MFRLLYAVISLAVTIAVAVLIYITTIETLDFGGVKFWRVRVGDTVLLSGVGSRILTGKSIMESFGDASAKSKLADAPRVLRSFESAYLAAEAERRSNAVIAEKDLIFTPPADNKLFRYDFVTSANGGVVGCKATALSDVGKFTKGSFLKTVYMPDDEVFAHCVDGDIAAVNAAESFVPEFFSNRYTENLNYNTDGAILCSDLPEPSAAPAKESSTGSVQSAAPAQQDNTGSAQSAGSSNTIDKRLINADGEAWTHYAGLYGGVGDEVLIFRSNGSYDRKLGRWYRSEDGESHFYPEITQGTWRADGNKIIMTDSDGDRTVWSYTVVTNNSFIVDGEYADSEFTRERITQ